METKPEKVMCEHCHKEVDRSEIVKVYYSLKKRCRMKPQYWCNDCREKNEYDFCEFCGCNSLGSSPCAGCRNPRKWK